MSRRYLGALALAASLVLAVGLFVRHRLMVAETPAAAAPPSEASPLQQLSQGGQLRRTTDYLAERIAAVAPLVEYLPDVGAAGVRWSAETVVSTRSDRPVIAVRAARADSAQPVATLASDSAPPAPATWVVLVGRRPDGRLLSAAGIAGGRTPTRCASRAVEEYVVGVPLGEGLAGAGMFDLDGRALAVVVRCGDRLAALPVGEVARVLADTSSAVRGVREAFGLAVRALDERSRRYFGSDSGLLVTEVHLGGPAAAAGLRVGDLIVAVDGQPARAEADLLRVAAGTPVDSHTVTRRRGAVVADLRLATADTPAPAPTADGGAGALGLDVTPPPSPHGVPVTTVRPGSAAAAAGLRPGDRLVRVGEAAATSPAVAQRLLAAAGSGAGTDAPAAFIVYARDSVERGVLLPR